MIIGIVLAVLLPLYTYVPPERRAASELIISSADAKIEITESILSTQSTVDSGVDVIISKIQHNEFGEFNFHVSKDGVITGNSKKYSLRFTLTPNLLGENVEWNCVFNTTKYAPVSCR